MPTYEITGPDGTKYEVTGPGTEQEALAQVQAQQSQPQEPAQPQRPEGPGYGMDMLKSAGAGLRSGVEGIAGAIGSANQLTGDLAGKAAGFVGAGPQMQEFVRNVGRRANLMPFAPTTEEVAGATDAAVGGERYQPQTLPGKYARTVAEFAPNVALGPGTALRKGVATLASGLASEAAGQATEGTAAEPWARVGGAVLGGGLTAGRNPKVPRTATEETAIKLNKNKEDAYALSEKAGVIIKPAGMKRLADKVKDDLAEFGYDETLHPGAKAVLRKIEENQGQNVTLKGLDGIRKVAGNVGYIPMNKSNNTVVNKIVDHIEDLYRTQNPEHMAGIDTKIGAQALDVARQFAHREFKLERTLNLIKRADSQSGRNITDTVVKSRKTQLAKINDPLSPWGRGYNAAEKELAGKAGKYTGAERALHGLSVLNPVGGGKLSAAGHLATGAANIATGNIAGLGLQAVGALAGHGFQKWGEALAKKTVDEFVDAVANGGVPAPAVKHSLLLVSKEKRAAIIRALAAANASQNSRQPLEITVGRRADQ